MDGGALTVMAMFATKCSPKESVTVTEIVYVPAEEKEVINTDEVDSTTPLMDHE